MSDQKISSSLDMEENVASLLCYLFLWLGALIILLLEKKNATVRFHAVQSILLSIVWFVLGVILPFIPFLGWMLLPVLSLGGLALWIILMIKAYQGEPFSLPILTDKAKELTEKIKL